MSNEELAAAIRAGATERMGELWERVAGLVKWKANQVMSALDLRGNPCSVEFDDLYQSGYPALVAAVDSYNQESGAFSTWFMYHLKRAFAEATGYRTKAGQNEPLNNALSLDAPIDNEEDISLFGDVIPDPKATANMEAVLGREYQRQLHEALETSLSALSPLDADVLRLRYYRGMTIEEVAKEKNVESSRARQIESKALTQIRRPENSHHLRTFHRE